MSKLGSRLGPASKCDPVVPFLKDCTGVKIGKSAWPSGKALKKCSQVVSRRTSDRFRLGSPLKPAGTHKTRSFGIQLSIPVKMMMMS